MGNNKIKVVVILGCLCCFLIIASGGRGRRLSHDEQQQMDVLNHQMSEAMKKDGEKMKENAEEMQEDEKGLKENTNANINSTEKTRDSRVIDGKTSSFEKFDSKYFGNKYDASGVADVVGNDDNAILVTINSSGSAKVTIKGDIEFENGEAGLYLITPDQQEKRVLSSEAIKKNKEINATVDLGTGSNQIILKGDSSIVNFNLKFITETNGGSISYD